MRDFDREIESRVEFIRETLAKAGVSGVVFANSGGKDSALVGILCKMACDDTVSLILPCGVERNYGRDKEDALALAEKYSIATRCFDLAEAQEALTRVFGAGAALTEGAVSNISPRLRMIALYAVAAGEGRLVAGTGNLSERYLGYFTKWGDGAYDFNPIADLTCTEVLEFLRFLNAPASIIDKPPSAGLFEGQTDEGDIGLTYANIDKFIQTGEASPRDKAILKRYNASSEHKRKLPLLYSVE